MKTINSDKVVCFDVDDTLISQDPEQKSKYKTKAVIDCYGFKTDVCVIDFNVEAIKRHKRQGQIIIVWSAAGHKWAESVVKSLGLTKYVDYAMSKPNWYYDDLHVEKWMGNPRWGGDRR
jgi:hydroxymethylpyrimidine pyrophosphatase-like HAD family hydrolase